MNHIDTEGRVELFRARIGSHNYNLNDETSDEDWKVICLPSFEDLYSGKVYSSPTNVGEDLDYSVKDIRFLSGQVFKANITFLEMFYSDVVIVNPSLNSETRDLIYKLFSMRDRIVRANLPKMYDTCIGMHKQRIKSMLKGSVNTQHLVNQYGYCTKNAMHSYRYVDFLYRFLAFDWDFEKAIRYNSSGSIKRAMAFKKGEMGTESDVARYLNGCFNDVEKFKHRYKNEKVDTETIEEVNEIIKNIVKANWGC